MIRRDKFLEIRDYNDETKQQCKCVKKKKYGPIKYKIFQKDHENVSNIRIYKTYKSNYTRILRETLEINFNILSQSTNSLHQKMLLLHDKGT